MRIGILADDSGARLAHELNIALAGRGHEVAIERVAVFPIADALVNLLLTRRARYDHLVVAVADSSRNRAWVLAELAHAALHVETTLGVETIAGVPAWGANDHRVFVVGAPLPASFNSAVRMETDIPSTK